MLKIYKHIKAQAQIKVKMGTDKENEPIFENVKFTGGRVLGTDEGTVGGSFSTKNELLQKAIESHVGYGKMFFIDHKINQEKIIAPEEKDFKIYPGIDTINRVKNILKEDFSDKIKGEDLRDTEGMLRFCKRTGIAFPDFFIIEQGHFSKILEDRNPLVKTKVHIPVVPPVVEPIKQEQQKVDFEEVEVDEEELMAMKREKLNETAREFGVISPESLANKKEVVDAILNI